MQNRQSGVFGWGIAGVNAPAKGWPAEDQTVEDFGADGAGVDAAAIDGRAMPFLEFVTEHDEGQFRIWIVTLIAVR